MKNLKVVIVSAVLLVAGLGIYANQNTNILTDLALDNIEALARAEDDGFRCRTNSDYSSICNYYDRGAFCPCGF